MADADSTDFWRTIPSYPNYEVSRLGAIRRILTDGRLRRMMGEQIRALSCADAAARLGEAITALAGKNDFTDSQRNNVPSKRIPQIKRSIGGISA